MNRIHPFLIALVAAVPQVLAVQPPHREWSDYQVIMWEGPSASERPDKLPLYYQRLREMGVTAGMVYSDGDPKPLLDAKFPFYVENMVNRGLCLKFSSSVTDWDAFVSDWRTDRSESRCVRDYSLDDPHWLADARKQMQHLVRKNAPHQPLLYDIRDELSVTISANPFDYDFSESALAAFRDWLKSQYSSLDDLNARWETSFTRWDDIRPFTTDRIKHRMASGDAEPRGKPDWYSLQQLKFDLTAARARPTAWNFSPWADHRTYMDISLARTLGALREAAREIDPLTPVGIEGTQMPAAFGGYDLWRLSQVLDWVEPYDICDAREIFGSFMPGRTMLTTVGEQDAAEARRRLWHLLLSGDDGCIIWWSEDCLDWNSPDYQLTPRAKALAPVLKELRSPLASLFRQAERQRDPIAIHYSQPSIQTAWMIESTVDGSTWLRRFSSHEAAHNRHAQIRHGWLKLLEDAGFDPVFVSSEQIESGILETDDFRAVVLPQSWALSDREAERIVAFAQRANQPGVVLADGHAGLFDQHCRLRTRGVLDELFLADGTTSVVAVKDGAAASHPELQPVKYPAMTSSRANDPDRTSVITALRDVLSPIEPEVIITPTDARIKVWRFRTGETELLALERNRSYRMGEDLRQSADNPDAAGSITVTVTLPAAAHVVNAGTRTHIDLTRSFETVISDAAPSLFAVTRDRSTAEELLRHVHTD